MLLKITKYSHHFSCDTPFTQVRNFLNDFAHQYAEKEVKKVKGRIQISYPKVYASINVNRTSFRFHINTFQQFIDFMIRYNFPTNQYQIVTAEGFDPDDSDMNITAPYPPHDYQVPLIEYLCDTGIQKVLSLQTGRGKATSVNAPVLTPTGWRPIGDLQPNDMVVTPDGSEVKVLSIHPQGKRQMYKFTFRDGRTVKADGDHLWKVYYINTSPHKRWRIATTKEIMRWMAMPNPRVYIPLIEPFKGFHQDEVPIDPYLLGALLGDGCITGISPLSICNPDAEIIDSVREKVEALGLELSAPGSNTIDYRINRGNCPDGMVLKTLLARVGLLGRRSNDKFIPPIYLDAPLEVRRELIRGLMDTDGFTSTDGTISYTTVSPQLAEDMQYIIRSFGDQCKISKKIKHYTHNGEKKQGQLAYQLNIRSKKPSEYFNLSRKKDRTNDDNQYSKDLKLHIKSIEPVGVEEAVCIAIDHPEHLYVTKDFIVTHNTFTALHAIARIKKRTIIVLPGKYVERWVGDLCGADKVLDLTPSDVRLVRGSAAMVTLLEDGVAGTLTEKVIIITATTLYNYYKAYNENSVDYESYPCPPYDMYKVLGVGVRIIDEVHENIHLNYTQDLFTHIYKTISLSATLEFDNKTTDRMCNILFPKSMQVNNGEWVKYINCVGLYYELDQPTKLRWTAPGMGSYSHTTFEMSLLKRPQSLKKYTAMIVDLINNICIKKRDPDDKILIFAATKDMCTHLTNAFKNQWPLMTINRYVGEDDYENLISAEMVVSTLLSAGTAVDIPGLRYVLMTTARRSSQSNIQALGRLRQMKKKPDVNPEFYYLINRDIPKHIEYHKHKMEIFKDKVLNHKTMETHYRI